MEIFCKKVIHAKNILIVIDNAKKFENSFEFTKHFFFESLSPILAAKGRKKPPSKFLEKK